jgi:hypothetical protein
MNPNYYKGLQNIEENDFRENRREEGYISFTVLKNKKQTKITAVNPMLAKSKNNYKKMVMNHI